MTKKDVATTEDNPFSTEVPAHIDLNSNRGSEGVSNEDITLPRLSIIQDLSPQHKKNKPEYIPGAEPGMIFNTVSNVLYGNKIYFVPVFFQKEWVIWKDQNKGGGFRGAYDTEAEAKMALQELEDRADCEVVDTAQHYGLILQQKGKDWEASEVVISMSRSQMKVNRKLNANVRMAGGDRWSRVYEMSVVEDSNAAGQEYFNWHFRQLGFIPEHIKAQAESMYEAVKSGARKVTRETEGKDEMDEVTEEDMENM